MLVAHAKNRYAHVSNVTKRAKCDQTSMIDKQSSVPLYLQIQNYLVDEIHQGSYAPGARVPSELELAAQLSVSRMTARKALDALVSKGMLYRRKGKGTYVSDSIVSYNLTTMQSFSRTLQARGYHVDTRILLIDAVVGPPDILAGLNLDPGSKLVVVRRLRLVESKPAAIHIAYLDHRVYAPLLHVDLGTRSLLDAMHDISGVPMSHTNDSVQADLASREEAALLEIKPGSPVLRVEGVAYSEYGEPTRFSKAIYRGDMFRLSVRNTSSLAASLDISSS
jgi:GntR family transcriptional regulator